MTSAVLTIYFSRRIMKLLRDFASIIVSVRLFDLRGYSVSEKVPPDQLESFFMNSNQAGRTMTGDEVHILG